MNYGKEFKKFATKHQGVNAMYYDKIVANEPNKYDSLYH
jgi:ATP-dependent Clp protease protease subunit